MYLGIFFSNYKLGLCRKLAGAASFMSVFNPNCSFTYKKVNQYSLIVDDFVYIFDNDGLPRPISSSARALCSKYLLLLLLTPTSLSLCNHINSTNVCLRNKYFWNWWKLLQTIFNFNRFTAQFSLNIIVDYKSGEKLLLKNVTVQITFYIMWRWVLNQQLEIKQFWNFEKNYFTCQILLLI